MIQVNDKTRIVKVDSNNLAVEVLKTITSEKKGKYQSWHRVGYYGSLRTSLIGLLEHKLFSCVEEETTIQTLVNKIETVISEILNDKEVLSEI